MVGEKNWKELWEKKGLSIEEFDPIKLDGFDSGAGDLDRKMIQQIIEAIKNKLDLSSKDDLLEVGCGAGMLLIPLSKFVKSSSGIDMSNSLISRLKEHINAELHVSEANHLPFNDMKFDKILCHSVFQYFNSLEYAKKVINEMVRVCKNGGKILIMDIPDLAKKKANDEFRMKINPVKASDKGLQHLFYEKDFFRKICAENNLKCTIWDQNIEGYNNSKFRFNVLIDVKKR